MRNPIQPAYHECPSRSYLMKNLLKTGLEEDSWQWDWTTLGVLTKSQKPVTANVVAKAEGVWAANGLIDGLNALYGEVFANSSEAKTELAVSKVRDGVKLKPGQIVATWKGP